MILKRILTAILLFLAIQSVQGEEPRELFELLTASGRTSGRNVMLVDGQLLALSRIVVAVDPDVKPAEWNARFIELHDTEKGQLIILRPKADVFQAAERILDYEGYFVTADYSNMPPSIKLTKKAEKYSYWKVPKDKEGPIVNVSDFKKPAYLSVDTTKPIKYKNGGGADTGYLEYFRVTLSLDSTNLFKVRRRPTADKNP